MITSTGGLMSSEFHPKMKCYAGDFYLIHRSSSTFKMIYSKWLITWSKWKHICVFLKFVLWIKLPQLNVLTFHFVQRCHLRSQINWKPCKQSMSRRRRLTRKEVKERGHGQRVMGKAPQDSLCEPALWVKQRTCLWLSIVKSDASNSKQ